MRNNNNNNIHNAGKVRTSPTAEYNDKKLVVMVKKYLKKTKTLFRKNIGKEIYLKIDFTAF